MLPPDSRVVLVDALRPPPGAQFDRGIALTFTLGLESALVAPLAFAGNRIQSDQLDPLEVLHAARSCTDRLDIFCQAGQVHVPHKNSDLLSLLEPMVHPVTPTRPGALFHPKLWAVRYLLPGGEGHAMRLLIGSRNLNADCSWDTCLRLDGTLEGRPKSSNKPIADLLRYAVDLAVTPVAEPRTRAIKALIEDVRRAAWELPDGADGLEFFVPGVPGAKAPGFEGTRAALISPFWNEAGREIVGRSDDLVLVGRQEELDRLPEERLDEAEAYVLNELAGLDQSEAGDDPHAGALTGLHAKIYVIEYDRRAWMYVGSANATDAAFGRNVELLARLTGGKKTMGIARLMDRDAGLSSILEPYIPQPPVEEDKAEHELENALRAAAALPMTATVSVGGGVDDSWTIQLESREPVPMRDDIAFSTALLTTPQNEVPLDEGIPVCVGFEGLATTDVTPFVVITATNGRGGRLRTVALASLVNDPADRLDRLLARQVDTPEKFLKFLALLLGIGAVFDQGNGGSRNGRVGNWAVAAGTPVLELLLTAVADHPEQLDTLGRLVDRLQCTDAGMKALPEGFLDVWKVVTASRSIVRGGPYDSAQ